MKVIAIGDPHFKTDNIPEVNMFIERLEKLAENEKPNLIVILGDVLHTHERLHITPLNSACNFVNKMRNIAETVILVGNHDAISNQIFLSENHWMNFFKDWKNVIVADKVIKKYNFVFCPYVPVGRFQEALNTISDWKTADCIFAHQEFFGCKMAAIVSTEGDKWPENYPNIVSGHIHGNQTIKNIYYPGSSMQHAFGESEKNIIPILTFENGKYTLKEVDLQLPRKKIIYTDVASIDDLKIPEASEDKVKISIAGNYEEFKAFKKTKKYREITKSGTKVIFKPKKHEIEEKKKIAEPVDETDFSTILSSLVMSEKNSFLYQVFELVINNKVISEDDIHFL